jgi:hypothetical protein
MCVSEREREKGGEREPAYLLLLLLTPAADCC